MRTIQFFLATLSLVGALAAVLPHNNDAGTVEVASIPATREAFSKLINEADRNSFRAGRSDAFAHPWFEYNTDSTPTNIFTIYSFTLGGDVSNLSRTKCLKQFVGPDVVKTNNQYICTLQGEPYIDGWMWRAGAEHSSNYNMLVTQGDDIPKPTNKAPDQEYKAYQRDMAY
ncbi:hypothetical protein BU23DRAFT_633860 [Bimuria novae-zelandiae CBS 107.79]|uniref:Uncharacterized protein n=1 Tax=Bimuria novae-zelandiae CBS 107.79 TaxID=1447943 RepID=A0A6A5VEV4_9PLEO|nr:hypothetical protein BU23DRAFT_633860 [Bimuria novae-zelandiae CBS 107.79]